MKLKSKLSIITINFNNLEGLQKTVDSVINQTCKDYEYIIIDGGSTDGSKEYIQNMHKHFDYWISEPDTGIYNAMNKGIEASSGDFILFLNSGDYLYSKFVMKQINELVLVKNIIYVFDVMIENYKIEIQKGKVNSFNVFKNYICHCGTIYPTTKLRYNENYRIISDWIFTVEMMKIFECIYKPGTISVFTLGGISNTEMDLKHSELYSARRKLFPFYFIKSKGFLRGIYELLKYHLR